MTYTPDDHPDHVAVVVEAMLAAGSECDLSDGHGAEDCPRARAILAAVGPLIVRDALNEAADALETRWRAEWSKTFDAWNRAFGYIELMVPCDQCEQAPGEPCVTASGHPARDSHSARSKFAQRVAGHW